MSSSPLKKPFDKLLDPTQVLDAQARIAPYIDRTPIMRSDLLDAWLGHEVVFKVDALQRTGAFKIRGALNTLLQLREAGQLPE